MAFEIPQTTYTNVPPVAVEGMEADGDPGFNVTGYTEVAMAQGRFVARGASNDTVKPIAAAADVTNLLKGATVFQTVRTPLTPHYPAKVAATIKRRGTIWMKCAQDALTDGGPVFIVHTGADAGLPSGAAGGGATATAVPNGAARCLIGGAVGDLCKIEINLP